MNLLQPITDLLVATWELDASKLAARLPAGLEPIEMNGRAAVSLVAFRNGLGRLGLLPIPPYAQIDLRTPVTDPDGAIGVFIFLFHVTTPGLAARGFGIPVRREQIAITHNSVNAPGLGTSINYQAGASTNQLGEAEPLLHAHDFAYWQSGHRLRRMTGGHQRTLWHTTAIDDNARYGPLVTFGLEQHQPNLALYSPDAELRAHLPTRTIKAGHRS